MSGWIKAAGLTLVLASYWGAYQHGRTVERADALAASAIRDSGERLAEVIGERGARHEEQLNAQAEYEVRVHAQEERQVADAGAADANASGRRLQHEAAKLASIVGCPGPDAAAVARGQTATRAAMVLSDLLERSVDTNRELAQAYDRARIAGLACEAIYTGLAK